VSASWHKCHSEPHTTYGKLQARSLHHHATSTALPVHLLQKAQHTLHTLTEVAEKHYREKDIFVRSMSHQAFTAFRKRQLCFTFVWLPPDVKGQSTCSQQRTTGIIMVQDTKPGCSLQYTSLRFSVRVTQAPTSTVLHACRTQAAVCVYLCVWGGARGWGGWGGQSRSLFLPE
jgi:hypothetical protein